MFPAARILDPITHDQVVPCGVIGPPLPGRPMTVMIEYLPAAVMGDFVTCTGALSAGIAHPPQAGPPPAVPPSVPIVKGSTTVLIGFMPAARWIVDPTGCGVLLGDVKLMATRTVFIGDIGGAGGGTGPTQVAQSYASGTSASIQSVSQNEVGPLQPQEEKEKGKTWIGIKLQDFDGSPMPNQDFKATLNGGQVLSGQTNDKGYAKFENIDPDQGEVLFIDIPEHKEEGKSK